MSKAYKLLLDNTFSMPKIGLAYKLDGSIDDIAESMRKLKYTKGSVPYFSRGDVSELGLQHCSGKPYVTFELQLSSDNLEDVVRAASVFLERVGEPAYVIPYDTHYDIVGKARAMERTRKNGKPDIKQWIPIYGFAKAGDDYRLRKPSLDDNVNTRAPLFRLYQGLISLVTLPLSLPYFLLRNRFKK